MNPANTATSIALTQWHGGDANGLDALIERHLPWIREQVHKKMGHVLRQKGETGDYVQDAMVRFLQYGPRFMVSDDDHFRALLYLIVQSTLKNRYHWFTARRREVALERPLPPDTVLNLDPPREGDKTPSQVVVRNEREAWVRLGLELLDWDQRELLVLRQWDKKSFAEIGEHYDITADAARMRHYQAMDALTKKISLLRNREFDQLMESSAASDDLEKE